jgi:hypothetical protein
VSSPGSHPSPARLASLAVHTELPGYKPYTIPSSVNELHNHIYKIVDNVTISGDSVFTFTNARGNKTTADALETVVSHNQPEAR